MIPVSHVLDQTILTTLLDHDPMVQDYRQFFALLDWSLVQQWEGQQSFHRRPPTHSEAAYIKAFLLRIREGFMYSTQLRRFLLKHPLLIIELGFHLELDPKAPYGFDAHKTLPSRYWLGEKLRTLDPLLLQQLLEATVHSLQAEIPGLGETVAFDVKHIYAWVKENNLRAYVTERFDKHQVLSGDPDCKLGVKRSTNQEQPDGSTKERKELLWGYGSGVAAATTPDYGDVVLAEYTQPFNEGDVTSFRPLYQRAAVALQAFPIHVTADAAFDAWYVYEAATRHGGIAAVPKNGHGHPEMLRDPDGVPRCAKGLRMTPRFAFQHTNGYRAQRFGCPLLFPTPTGETCERLSSNHGQGCHKDPNWEAGGLMRVLLDRSSPLYKAVYTQRTSCERINSQAKELGIERPRLRNRRSIANLNRSKILPSSPPPVSICCLSFPLAS
ncbi:hypothetical protein KSD_82270 [Ktedonobacter sp. SOSP1-85]|uniref:hypothetical protein n=1 Tax=Ktedonobacter sp. SOSP1-85 TaxID=2778367 RepID=UPI001A324236|nr:hypothetical protein [Ktedonobacter sp. SOSP1-85]GHO80456.1 hypothetical protein KSD_82270 [Ktedonobacter sp. SOSP1-85]